MPKYQVTIRYNITEEAILEVEAKSVSHAERLVQEGKCEEIERYQTNCDWEIDLIEDITEEDDA